MWYAGYIRFVNSKGAQRKHQISGTLDSIEQYVKKMAAKGCTNIRYELKCIAD